jgi:hypothetical protein
MKTIKIILVLHFLLSISLFAQIDSTRQSTGDIYQDLSKWADISNARYGLVVNKDTMIIDTVTLKKIDPDWVEKVNILTSDENDPNSPVAFVYIYIHGKNKKEVKDAVVGEK